MSHTDTTYCNECDRPLTEDEAHDEACARCTEVLNAEYALTEMVAEDRHRRSLEEDHVTAGHMLTVGDCPLCERRNDSSDATMATVETDWSVW